MVTLVAIVGAAEATIIAVMMKILSAIDCTVPQIADRKKLAEIKPTCRENNSPNTTPKLTLSNTWMSGNATAVMEPRAELTRLSRTKTVNHDIHFALVSAAFSIPQRFDDSSSRRIRKIEIPQKVGPSAMSHCGSPPRHASFMDTMS